jgi:hypothetical protein
MLYVKFYDEEYNPEDTPNKYNVVRDKTFFLNMLYYLHMYGNVK